MIVGGGIAGLSVALPLARAGAEVTVLERRRPGAGSSDAAAGILSPGFEADLASPLWPLQAAARREWDALPDRLGVSARSLGFRRDGLLEIAASPDDATAFRVLARDLASEGWPARVLDPGRLSRDYPGVGGTHGGLLLPGAAWVEPRAVVRALAAAVQSAGGHLVRTDARGLERVEGGIGGVRTSSGRIGADRVILAAGAWSRSIVADDAPTIEPVHGQMIRFAPSASPPPLQLASRDGVYLLPRADGCVEAGATMEAGRWDEASQAAAIQRLTAGARRLWPALQEIPVIEAWTGLRPFAADGLPVLGPSPRHRGLYWATGYGRNGILIAPLCGRLVADELLGGERADLLRPFPPERLGRRTQEAGEM